MSIPDLNRYRNSWMFTGVALCMILCCGGGPTVFADESLETIDKEREVIGQIAITFDDLPVARTYEKEDRYKITKSILTALKKHSAPAAGFVIGDNIDSDWDILAAWLEDGHTLGNHTYSHHDLHTTRPEVFIEDMIRGAEAIETFLTGFGQKKRYFRHPYLHYGESEEVRNRIVGLLKDNKRRIAHVSVDTDDYLYNLTAEKYRYSTDTLVINSLRDEYIDHVLTSLDKAEALAQIVVNRRVKHILLLHANRLNGRFLDELLTAIYDRGYEFIGLEKALTDKVYRKKDSYFGPKGISKLERIARSNPEFIPPDF